MLVQCGSYEIVPGKVDVVLSCYICNVTVNIQECSQRHGIAYQEQYDGCEVLETFAPALPVQAQLLTTIRKLVGRKLVQASDEEQAVQSKTPQENHAYSFLSQGFQILFQC